MVTVKVWKSVVLRCCVVSKQKDDDIGHVYACICLNDSGPGVNVEQNHVLLCVYADNDVCLSL